MKVPVEVGVPVIEIVLVAALNVAFIPGGRLAGAPMPVAPLVV